MKFTEPQVFLIAEPQIIEENLQAYLNSVGASDWTTDAPSDAEKLPEIMGRLCYRSWRPGMNANVTKVREGNDTYLANILRVGHGSVLEHSQFSFIFSGVSRVFTHELVRHRVGIGISQESLRFVRLADLDFWFPDWARKDEKLMAKLVPLVQSMEGIQAWLGKHFQLDDKGVPFAEKKHKTSFMRRFAPIGLATAIGWSANIRTLRHVIEMRTSRHSEEEIRLVFAQVAKIMHGRYPNLFGDYKVEEVNGYPEYTTEARKV